MFIVISGVIIIMLTINTEVVNKNRKIEKTIEQFIVDNYDKGCDLKCLIKKGF